MFAYLWGAAGVLSFSCGGAHYARISVWRGRDYESDISYGYVKAVMTWRVIRIIRKQSIGCGVRRC